VNSGDIVSTTTPPVAIFAFGIEAFTSLAGSPITIDNSGALTVTAGGTRGIDVRNLITDNPIAITNSGSMAVTARGDAFGIYAANQNSFSGPIAIKNSGDVAVVAGDASGFTRDRSVLPARLRSGTMARSPRPVLTQRPVSLRDPLAKIARSRS
jgi:hypothetical protein